jgi:hypothetical protein
MSNLADQLNCNHRFLIRWSAEIAPPLECSHLLSFDALATLARTLALDVDERNERKVPTPVFEPCKEVGHPCQPRLRQWEPRLLLQRRPAAAPFCLTLLHGENVESARLRLELAAAQDRIRALESPRGDNAASNQPTAVDDDLAELVRRKRSPPPDD